MRNHDSYSLASQAAAEYAQDDETFRAALQNKMVFSQNRDTRTYPVMGNRVFHGLASQASAEYGQEDDETFRSAL